MRIYYHGAYKKRDVSSKDDFDATQSEAKLVLSRLHQAGSFMGLYLGPLRTLQFYVQDDGMLHAEVLFEKEGAIRYCNVNLPLAELLVEAAFKEEDLEQKIAFAQISWHDEVLKRPTRPPEPMPPGGVAHL